MNITEIISAKKEVVAKGRELVLVTTKSGAQVWVNKAQLKDTADQITYVHHKSGSTYTRKDGTTGTRTADANEFVGCGNASKFDVLDYLKSQGVTPVFSLS